MCASCKIASPGYVPCEFLLFVRKLFQAGLSHSACHASASWTCGIQKTHKLCDISTKSQGSFLGVWVVDDGLEHGTPQIPHLLGQVEKASALKCNKHLYTLEMVISIYFEIAQPISWFSTNHGIQSLFCFHFQVPTTPVKQQAGEDENIRFQLRCSKFKCI